MRIDLFLKVSGLLRKRSLASLACSTGNVFINGRRAKPSISVKTGDLIAVTKPDGTILHIEVIRIPAGQVSRKERTNLFRLLEEPDSELSGGT